MVDYTVKQASSVVVGNINFTVSIVVNAVPLLIRQEDET
jgi:hypothetical protein